MGQRDGSVKVEKLTAKSDDLNSIHGTHVVEGED